MKTEPDRITEHYLKLVAAHERAAENADEPAKRVYHLDQATRYMVCAARWATADVVELARAH
jgi:hypothetical protein